MGYAPSDNWDLTAMSATGYTSTGAFLDTGLGICRIHGDIVYTATRSNNTISFTNTYARIKYVRESGTWTTFYYGSGWTWRLYIGTSTQRSSNTLSGTKSVNAVDNGTSTSFNITVGASDTTYTGRIGAWFDGDPQTYTSSKTLSFPAAGSPSGQSISATAITTTTATLNAAISNWGSYCTAGTGQRIEYKKSTDSTWTNLAYSTSTSHSRSLTGLRPGTTYNIRTYTVNGAGLTGYSTAGTFKTKSATNLLASLVS